MQINELLKKVQEIELKTRKKTKQVFTGGYQSAFKGKGMTFTEVRDYQYGDDVRNIDWKVTARFNTPFVKIYEEERELSVFMIIDLSGSNNFGTTNKSKKDLILETVAILAFSATKNNDKIGVVFVTDKVEKYIPLGKGKKHVLLILRELINFKPESKRTNLEEGLRFFMRTIKRSSICFMISDFIDTNDLEKNLRIAGRKHDMTAIRIKDPAEQKLPKIGLMKMYHAEEEKYKWVNTNSKNAQMLFFHSYKENERKQDKLFRKAGIDFTTLSTEGGHILQLKNLFLQRSR